MATPIKCVAKSIKGIIGVVRANYSRRLFCCCTMFPCKLLLQAAPYFSLIWPLCNELAFCSIIVPLSFMELSL